MPNHQTRTHHSVVSKEQELASIGDRAVEVVVEAASVAQAKGKVAATRVEKAVREHPLVAVGVALGGGLLLGAIGHRLLEHKQTFGEALASRLGVDRLRSRIRHAL